MLIFSFKISNLNWKKTCQIKKKRNEQDILGVVYITRISVRSNDVDIIQSIIVLVSSRIEQYSIDLINVFVLFWSINIHKTSRELSSFFLNENDWLLLQLIIKIISVVIFSFTFTFSLSLSLSSKILQQPFQRSIFIVYLPVHHHVVVENTNTDKLIIHQLVSWFSPFSNTGAVASCSSLLCYYCYYAKIAAYWWEDGIISYVAKTRNDRWAAAEIDLCYFLLNIVVVVVVAATAAATATLVYDYYLRFFSKERSKNRVWQSIIGFIDNNR